MSETLPSTRSTAASTFAIADRSAIETAAVWRASACSAPNDTLSKDSCPANFPPSPRTNPRRAPVPSAWAPNRLSFSRLSALGRRYSWAVAATASALAPTAATSTTRDAVRRRTSISPGVNSPASTASTACEPPRTRRPPSSSRNKGDLVGRSVIGRHAPSVGERGQPRWPQLLSSGSPGALACHYAATGNV